MRYLRLKLAATWIFSVACIAVAQVPKNNPVAEWSVRLGQVGFPAGVTPKANPVRFSPIGGRVFLGDFLGAYLPKEDERKAIQPLVEKIIEGYEGSAKQGGFANDVAGSLAFAVYSLFSLGKGVEVPSEAMAKLTDRFRAYFETESVKSATDRQKQEVYEWALGSAGLILGLATQVSEASAAVKIQIMAKALLQALTGANFEQFELNGGELLCRARSSASTDLGSTSLTLAPNFRYAEPKGWESRGGWFIKSVPDGNDVTSAMVRLPPPVVASGNMSDALRKLWSMHIPAELAQSAGSMVYRRYVGSKLFSQFLFGKGVERGRRSVTLFSLILIDCGTHWQPMVIAQRYDSSGFEENHAPYTFPKSWAFAEEFLASLQCPGAPNVAIVSAADLAGDYGFGSGSKMDYVNIYTGATAFSYVSYGGDLNLAPDGSFSYRYGSASGVGGAASFRGATGTGRWSIQGDILTCRYAKYDQGDGHFVKEHTYRIAGVTQFADGVKVAVLLSDLEKPVSSASVADGSQWYSTKKR